MADMESSCRRFRIARSTSGSPGAENQTPPSRSRKVGPACDRCRTFKKRCSRTFPACDLCSSAGQRCIYSSTDEVQRLQARIEWLSQIINSSTAGLNIETVETGTALEILRAVDDKDAVDIEKNGGDSLPQTEAAAPFPGLPADVAPRRLVDAYFSNVHKAYPFIDRNKALGNLEARNDFPLRKNDAGSTILYLMMAIGYTTLQRAGQIAETPQFDIDYAGIIQTCLRRENLESLQILVLLTLYSLFDPAGASPWSIVGVVSRQAVLLGLTRKASDEDGRLSALDVELRHRLFWSIFVLDRMVAASLGLAMALTDDNMDVPLPSLTVEEFASPERAAHAAILQTSRHVIRLRQLEDRILRQIHFRKPMHGDSTNTTVALARADRRATVQDIQADIENWYSSGCLVSPPPEATAITTTTTTTTSTATATTTTNNSNLPIHSSVTWLSARYYHLLLLLHYPCANATLAAGGQVQRAELLRLAQKHLQSTAVLFQQRQLPLNRITLCRLIPVALLLMHGFVWCGAKPFSEEASTVIAVLDAFPVAWAHAHRAAGIVRQFLAVLSSSSTAEYEPLYFGPYPGVYGGPLRERCLALVRPHIEALLELMHEVLGRATSFAFQELPEDGEAVSYSAMYAGQESLVGGPTLLPQATGGADVLDLGWAGLELDFL